MWAYGGTIGSTCGSRCHAARLFGASSSHHGSECQGSVALDICILTRCHRSQALFSTQRRSHPQHTSTSPIQPAQCQCCGVQACACVVRSLTGVGFAAAPLACLEYSCHTSATNIYITLWCLFVCTYCHRSRLWFSTQCGHVPEALVSHQNNQHQDNNVMCACTLSLCHSSLMTSPSAAPLIC